MSCNIKYYGIAINQKWFYYFTKENNSMIGRYKNGDKNPILFAVINVA